MLTGLYYVDSTKALTIPAGTLIMGDTGSALLTSRGPQILATGTQERPIVFTSSNTSPALATG